MLVFIAKSHWFGPRPLVFAKYEELNMKNKKVEHLGIKRAQHYFEWRLKVSNSLFPYVAGMGKMTRLRFFIIDWVV